MNAKELNERLVAIDTEAQERKNALYVAYAHAHNRVKIGDVIKNRFGLSILVEDMRVYKGIGETPQMYYYGPELKKDGTRRKDGSKAYIYQRDL